MKQYFNIAGIIIIIFPFSYIQKEITKNSTEHDVSIALTNLLRFIFAMQSICWAVPSTSYVFLLFNIGFPQLSQCSYFLGGACICDTITFLESTGLILGVVGIKYRREFIFPVLQFMGNLNRRLHSQFLKDLHKQL